MTHLLSKVALVILTASATVATGAPVQLGQPVVCNFTTECIAGDVCTDGNFDVTVTQRTIDPPRAILETVFGTFDGIYSNTKGQTPENVVAFQNDTGDSYHLSWHDGAGWLSLHMPTSDMAITYLGTCTQ
ncbi:MAG: hypothetical protein AAF386_06295 [Pseudomonadota bacterium]